MNSAPCLKALFYWLCRGACDLSGLIDLQPLPSFYTLRRIESGQRKNKPCWCRFIPDACCATGAALHACPPSTPTTNLKTQRNIKISRIYVTKHVTLGFRLIVNEISALLGCYEVSYRRFGTTYRSHLQGSSVFLGLLDLSIWNGYIFFEKSGTNQKSTLRKYSRRVKISFVTLEMA